MEISRHDWLHIGGCRVIGRPCEIQLPSRNVHRRRDENGNGQPVGESHGEQIAASRLDRTDPDKNQRESPNEFSDARTNFFHAFAYQKTAEASTPILLFMHWWNSKAACKLAGKPIKQRS